MKKLVSAWLLGVVFLGAVDAAAASKKIIPIEETFEPAQTLNPATHGKVAVVQWAPDESTPLGVTVEQAEAFKQGNRLILENYIREAAANGAKLVVTPEFAIVGYPDIPELKDEDDEYRNREDIRPYVETIPGPSTQYFGKLAAELKIHLHIGFAEVDPKSDLYYNTVVAIDPYGKVAAKYRKVNLYEGELNFLVAGDKAVSYVGPFGRVGLIICADVYHGFPLRDLRKAKTDVLALSTSWAQANTGMEHFQSAARYMKLPLIAANQRYFPDSGVINADGSLQSHIRQSQGVAYGYLPWKRKAP